ncbi:hypothetical protein L208DRAFT_1376100 [Tricholoma matsutake]|nr:hypothetical protein L208DRAFT_1376100 [Tricholoma matsutake 945]
MDSFAQCTQIYGVQILDICWNTHGAFIGTVTNAWLDDMSSLIFETFLVAPLLDQLKAASQPKKKSLSYITEIETGYDMEVQPESLFSLHHNATIGEKARQNFKKRQHSQSHDSDDVQPSIKFCT